VIRFVFRLIFRVISFLVLLAVILAVYYLYDSGQLPGVKRKIEDTAVTASVMAAIKLHKDLSERTIRVDTEGTVVTLTGAVASEAEAARAIELASNVEGVKSVTSRLVVSESLTEEADPEDGEVDDRSFGQRLDDTALLTKVRAALHLDRETRAIELDIHVDAGAVVLTGTVDTEELADRIRKRVESVSGVRSVDAQLEIVEPTTEPP